MRSYHANSGAGLDGLTLKKHEEPKPGLREVLVRVRANSLNFRELSVLRGTYPLPVKPDVVMGADGAGEVVALGEGVTRLKKGDRVAAAMFPPVDGWSVHFGERATARRLARRDDGGIRRLERRRIRPAP